MLYEVITEPWVYAVEMGDTGSTENKINLESRITQGYEAVKEIVSKVWLYVALGILVGAGAHGYVPEDFMVALMGKSARITSYNVCYTKLLRFDIFTCVLDK